MNKFASVLQAAENKNYDYEIFNWNIDNRHTFSNRMDDLGDSLNDFYSTSSTTTSSRK